MFERKYAKEGMLDKKREVLKWPLALNDVLETYSKVRERG